MVQRYHNLLASSSTPALFHAALGIRLWGGIVASLAFIPRQIKDYGVGLRQALAKVATKSTMRASLASDLPLLANK